MFPSEALLYKLNGADDERGEAMHKLEVGTLVELVNVNYVAGYVSVRPLDESWSADGYSECCHVRALPGHLHPLTDAAREALPC